MSSTEVLRQGKDAGFSHATLRRAADGTGVWKFKGKGVGARWYWSLPTGRSEETEEEDNGEGTGGNLLTPKDDQVNKLGDLPESAHPEGQSVQLAQLAHASKLGNEQVTPAVASPTGSPAREVHEW